MQLMTQELASTLPPIYSQDGKGDDAIVYAKYFAPYSSWYWYATEYDPDTCTFFGLVIGLETELGYFSLAELERYRDARGLPLERDLYFTPTTLATIRATHAAT